MYAKKWVKKLTDTTYQGGTWEGNPTVFTLGEWRDDFEDQRTLWSPSYAWDVEKDKGDYGFYAWPYQAICHEHEGDTLVEVEIRDDDPLFHIDDWYRTRTILDMLKSYEVTEEELIAEDKEWEGANKSYTQEIQARYMRIVREIPGDPKGMLGYYKLDWHEPSTRIFDRN